MSTAIVEVDNLSYEYPGQRALENVSFAIESGSITALVGPNGAGKTTLLRCLAGMDRPVTGSIRVKSIDVVEEPRRSHQVIGYLSDFCGLYPALSVRRNLAYVAAANGVALQRIASLVEQTAHELGLTERLDQRAAELSRGLRQRTAIAQAVIHAPSVVLLDEPASGLDPEARYQLGQLFLSLRQRGMTLLVSSHILAELEAYSTDMLVLNAGRIIQQRRLRAHTDRAGRIQIATTGGANLLLQLLAENPQVSAVEDAGESVVFNFTGSVEDRAALLASLVGHGIGICHFAVLAEDLQQSYLRTIGASGSAREP